MVIIPSIQHIQHTDSDGLGTRHFIMNGSYSSVTYIGWFTVNQRRIKLIRAAMIYKYGSLCHNVNVNHNIDKVTVIM